MTRIKQKKIERYILDEFLKYTMIKTTIVDIDEMETLDFILTCPNKKISVEHTKYLNSKLKKIEEFRKEVLNGAENKFKKNNNEALNVYFHYTQQKMDVKTYSKSYFVDLLHDTVYDIYAVNKDRKFYVSTKRNKIENEYFNKISVSNDTDNSLWQWIGAHRVEFADIKEIQKIIDRKSKLVNAYENLVDEKWLLIEAGKGHKSSSFRFDQLVRKSISIKCFDKVYLFDSTSREFFLLD